METVQSDVVIIGGGIAGTIAAWKLAERGYQVILLSSASPLSTNSAAAQGGIVYRGYGDSAEKLKADMLIAGAGLCNEQVVDCFARIAPDVVKELLIDTLQVPFDEEFALEAAHQIPRVLSVQDQTGWAIMERLSERVEVRQGAALSLYVVDGVCQGVYTQDTCYLSGATVLATGGAGDLYQYTSNRKEARGEGVALAHQAGAQVEGLHFFQFHPTAFPGSTCFLISEALRGEGALLLDADQRPFMQRYHEKADLAPRDITTRAIYAEMEQSGASHLWLDIHFQQGKHLKARFPTINAHLLEAGIDFTREAIPIVPCAHYQCGGVKASLDGKTDVPGLYAIGEVASTGIHGANRLASTSLLEGLVMGHLLSQNLSPHKPLSQAPLKKWEGNKEAIERLKKILWEGVGIVRTQEGLQRALENIAELEKETGYSPRFQNALYTGRLIAQSALDDPLSSGAHYLEPKGKRSLRENALVN